MGCEYIHFRLREQKAKTNVWEVVNNHSLQAIGEVRWYGPWRQYCFIPAEGTVFSRGCLEDIYAFIQNQMAARRETDGR